MSPAPSPWASGWPAALTVQVEPTPSPPQAPGPSNMMGKSWACERVASTLPAPP